MAGDPHSGCWIYLSPNTIDPSTITVTNVNNGNSSLACTWSVSGPYLFGIVTTSKVYGITAGISAPGYISQTFYMDSDNYITLVEDVSSVSFNGTLIDVLVDSNNKVVTYNGTPVCLALPDTYTRVPYIESTGTQYINTGFIPTTGTTAFKHTIVFESNSSSNTNKYICGTGVSEGRSGNLRISGNSLNGLYVGTSGAVAIISTTAITLNTKYTIVMDLHQSATNTVTLNGTSIGNTSTSTITSTRQMQLFALSNSYLPTGLRIYSSKIEKAGKLVYYLIAARRNSDSVLGMYDLVQDRFLTNAGTGNFITEETNVTLSFVRGNAESSAFSGTLSVNNNTISYDSSTTVTYQVPKNQSCTIVANAGSRGAAIQVDGVRVVETNNTVTYTFTPTTDTTIGLSQTDGKF